MDDFEFEDINVFLKKEIKKVVTQRKQGIGEGVSKTEELSRTENYTEFSIKNEVSDQSLGKVKLETEEEEEEKELCLTCGKIFKDKKKLKAHVLNMHTVYDPADCVCKVCDKQLKSPSCVVSHKKLVHSGDREKFICPDCGNQFKKKSNLKMHIGNVHTEYNAEELTCLVCHKQMKNPSGLLGHLKTVHEDNKGSNGISDPCPHCGKMFNKKSNMNIHITNVHTAYKEGDCRCLVCNKMLKNPESLKRHVKEVHEQTEMDENNSHFCHDCGKSYKNRKYLRGHIYTAHTENRKMCEFCFNEYKNPTALRQHLRLVHGPEQTVQCEICFKNFKNLSRLKHHRYDVHTIQNSRCEMCGKVYKNKWLLGKHIRYMHKGGKQLNIENSQFGQGLEESSIAPSYTVPLEKLMEYVKLSAPPAMEME